MTPEEYESSITAKAALIEAERASYRYDLCKARGYENKQEVLTAFFELMVFAQKAIDAGDVSPEVGAKFIADGVFLFSGLLSPKPSEK